MEPHNSNTRMKYAGGQNGHDEARRNHLLSLRRRPRFRTHAVEELTEDNINSYNSNLPRELPIHNTSSERSQPVGRKDGNIPPGFHHDPSLQRMPVGRSYSTATYQPVYNSHSTVPLYYFPPNQNVFQHNSHQLRTSEMPLVVDNDTEDDDVFVSSGSRNSINHSSIPNPYLPPNLPFSPLTVQLMQSRKRAHSAGDMMGLYSHNNVRFMYPNALHQVANPYRLGIPKSDSVSAYPYINNAASNVVIPQKVFVADAASSSLQKAPQHTIPLPISLPVTAHSTTTTLTNSQVAKFNVGNNSTTTSKSKKSSLHRDQQYLDASLSTTTSNKHRKIVSRKQHLLQSDQSSSSSPPHVSSALKSSTSSKPLIKKKVGWNDLATQATAIRKDTAETPQSNPPSNRQPEIDVNRVKENVGKFTAENKIGPYLIGPKLGSCPVRTISQYLVRKSNSNKYYMAKILRMSNDEEVKCGKMLLHTEHSLLSLLQSHSGVVRQHGIFKDCSFDKRTGTIFSRVSLVLDCLTPHEFNTESSHYLNLQQYVIQLKRLTEHEAIRIFYSIVTIIFSLHKNNVVHRDLKLGNMVLDKRTRRITLTNFGLGCHLTSEIDLLTDQRGSPAYISPDVLSDKPYAGKPSDMWSLGVVLYTMLYGQFPFYDQEPKKLFVKIKTVEYTIPITGQISANTNDVIRGLLTLDPTKRLTAREAIVAMETGSPSRSLARSTSFQVVPDLDNPKTLDTGSTYKLQSDRHKSEEESTRAFQLKMLSDDEEDDSSSGNPKTIWKYKRRIVSHAMPSRVPCAAL